MKLCVTYTIYQQMKSIFQQNDELKHLTTICLPYNADKKIMDHIQREELSVHTISLPLTSLIDTKVSNEFFREQLVRKLESYNCHDVLLQIHEDLILTEDHISMIHQFAEFLYKKRITLHVEMNHSILEMKRLIYYQENVYFQLCMRTDSYCLQKEQIILLKDLLPYCANEIVVVLRNLNIENLKVLSNFNPYIYYIFEEYCSEKEVAEWLTISNVQNPYCIREGSLHI